jgi:HSP20 family molecular chaperone IbpA
MSTDLLETGDMMVVTVRVPAVTARDLTIIAIGNMVRVVGPGDFRHEVTFVDADLDRLHAQLYRGILELRAPHAIETAPSAVARAVGIETLG